MTISDEKFEQLVSEGIETIPARFLKKLDNVAIVIADEPTAEQLAANHVAYGSTLLGLYEGIPLVARGEYYGNGEVLPDKITIFKNPILAEALELDRKHWDEDPREETLRKVARDTVWHEIAHYFGYDDHAIEEREDEGKNFSV